MSSRNPKPARPSSRVVPGSLRVEALESRHLLSAQLLPNPAPIHETRPADALVRAQSQAPAPPLHAHHADLAGRPPLAHPRPARPGHLAIARTGHHPAGPMPRLHAQDRALPGRPSLAHPQPARSAQPMLSILSWSHPIALGPGGDATPAATPASAPYTPAQIRHAYGFDQVGQDGSGQVIAIVDAYDHPTIASDLAVFSQQFGLPAANLIKATPQGQPAFDAAWAGEIALDVEWAHAIAPGATILLVEAKSSSLSDLFAAVDYAVSQGAKQVSMSWGGAEYWSEAYYDYHFNVPGVTFLASAGDTGAGMSYPAASPYVTAVGGTSLQLDAATWNRLSEAAWAGGGGGSSAYEAKPSYQSGFLSGTQRGGPDVAYSADPNAGYYVYNTASGGTWYQVGGTSAGATQWAGLIALVNQGRAAAGKPSLGSGLRYGTNQVLYSIAGGTSYINANGDYFDVSTGSNGLPATMGYDRATGLGGAVAPRLVWDLLQ